MGLPYKFVYADGNMVIAPGWRKDIHHMHMMQDLGITKLPSTLYAGTYSQDDFTGQGSIRPEWEVYGNPPSDQELMEMIEGHLQNEPLHPGRTARKPW